MRVFAQDARGRFIAQVISRLGEPMIRARWAMTAGLDAGPEVLRREVESLIGLAQDLGSSGRNDVAAFVLLRAIAGPALRRQPVWGWISALLRAKDLPPGGRMEAISLLLPEPERAICFADFDRR